MSAPKRLVLAFVSMLLAVLTLVLVMAVSMVAQDGLENAMWPIEILPVYLLSAFPGVILAAPFVLLFKDAAGSRLWWILAIGISIGPAFMLTLSLRSLHGHLDWQRNGSALVLSEIIGTLTTAFYVAYLRIVHPGKSTETISL